ISTDGGSTYTNLTQVTGVTSLGISGASATMQSASIDLTNYIGLSNLRIKFTYVGSANSAWVLDGVTVPPAQPITYQWSPTASLTPSTGVGQTVTATPATTTTYTVSTVVGGCTIGSSTVTVTVNPLPSITPAANAAPVCFSTNAQTTTLPYSAATNTPTKYSITWNSTPANSFVA